jgi:hypothetical protein
MSGREEATAHFQDTLEQYLCDVHTLSQHAFGSSEHFESVGKLLLGWGFFYVWETSDS